MRKISLILMLALGISAYGYGKEVELEVAVIETQDQKVSYLIGLDNGKFIGSLGINLDLAAYQQGVTDGVAKLKSKLNEEETSKVKQEYQKQMMVKREEIRKEQQKAFEVEAAANLKEGAAFLEANGVKEDVVTTESGLQYKIITAGTGPKPSVKSTVEVHYAGKLLDGTVFDSSIKRGVPLKIGVTGVIPGWTEALQLMPEGSKWELYIPADLGYGSGGAGSIGPNAVLIFEVELLKADVKQPEKG